MAPSNQPSHESCFKKEISCTNDNKREPDTKLPNFKRKTDTIQNDNKSESCSCEDCTEPNTCLYYDNRKNERPANLHLIDTLSQQKSAVEEQKNANLTSSKDSYCTTGSKTRGSDKISKPPDIYGFMVEPLSQQESEDDELKSAYLLQSKGSKGSCCIAGSKTKRSDKQSKSPANRTGSLPSGVYKVMRNILSQQESAVEGQKSVYLIQNNGSKGSCSACSKTRESDRKSKQPAKCQGPKSSGVYGVMMDILSQQEFAVEGQKNAYLTQSKDCKKCKRTAVKDKKSAYPPPDNCPGIAVTKLTSKAGSDKLNATSSSSGACTTELLKYVTEYKSTYSIQSKNSNCKSNNISLDRRTTTSSGSCKGKTRSNGSPCNCPSRRNSDLNYKQEYNVNKITTETNPMSYKNCSECSQLAKKKYDSPKYSAEVKLYESTNNAQELFRNILQTQAYKHQNVRDACDTYTKNKVSESPGYVFELPKNTHNLTLQNDCQSNKSSTSVSKLSGYVPELQEYLTTPNTREPVINTREVNITRYQVKWNTTDGNILVLKANCQDDDLATKKIFESPGYVVELPKIKEKKKYNCNGSTKFGSDKPECDFKQEMHIVNGNCSKCSNLAKKKNDSPKYSAELKRYEPTTNAQELFSNILQTQVYKHQNARDECDRCTKNIVSESPGYVFDLPKYTYNLSLQNDCHSKKSTKNDSKLSGNLPELLQYLTKPKTRESAMNTEVNINRCQVKWNTTDPNRLVLKASCHDEDLATKNKFESCGYVVELPKVQEKKKCACDGKLHESSGYVVDLPKVKGKKKCNCNGSAKKVSDKPECCFKQEKQTASESCSQYSQLAEEVLVNRGQVKWITSDATSLVLNAQKDDLAKKKKCESCGNVVELPQVENKRKCECDDKLFESSGYVVELPKVKEKKKCNCNDSTKFGSNKPECHEHATETPPEKRTESKKCTKCISIEFVARPLPKSENPPSQKKCVCKSDKNSLASPAQEPPCGCGAQQKRSETSPAQEPPCGCGAQQKSCEASPAQEPPCGCGAQQKSSEYPESESEHHACKMKSMEVPGYVFEIPKPKLNSCNCNNLSKNSIQSDTQNICINMVGTTTETGKAPSLKSPYAPNIYSMLCKKILKKQSETIEMLKKTYLPEKSDVQTDTCACKPPDERIEKRSAKEFSSSIESHSSYTISKCDLLKRIKDIYKACSCNICECKPIKNDAHECQNLCECDECLSSILSYEINQWQIRGGKPRDCVQCIKTMNIHHCQTLMVAPIGREENVSRLECTPCFEGGTVYPLDSHVVNEMSTSMNRHALCRCEVCLNENCDRNGVDACTCHKHNKIMSKPVGPDTYDFDVRTTKVVYDKPMFRQVG